MPTLTNKSLSWRRLVLAVAGTGVLAIGLVTIIDTFATTPLDMKSSVTKPVRDRSVDSADQAAPINLFSSVQDASPSSPTPPTIESSDDVPASTLEELARDEDPAIREEASALAALLAKESEI